MTLLIPRRQYPVEELYTVFEGSRYNILYDCLESENIDYLDLYCNLIRYIHRKLYRKELIGNHINVYEVGFQVGNLYFQPVRKSYKTIQNKKRRRESAYLCILKTKKYIIGGYAYGYKPEESIFGKVLIPNSLLITDTVPDRVLLRGAKTIHRKAKKIGVKLDGDRLFIPINLKNVYSIDPYMDWLIELIKLKK